MLVFAVGLAAIPLAYDYWSLLIVGIVIGFGNGLGSGSMLTLGADLSSKESRGVFLGLWFLIGNMGAATGPLIAGTVATILVLEATAYVFSGSSVLAALVFAFLVPETLKRFNRSRQAADGA
jgi:MFS family permease